MSGNLQVEEPSRRLTFAAAGARDTHVWDRSFLPWDAYFAVVWLTTAVFVLGADSPSPPYRITAVALMSLLIPWYLRAGRPAMLADGADERRALRYVVASVVIFLPCAFLVGETRLITFALAPPCFMLLPMRRAMFTMAVVNIVPVAGWALIWRPAAQAVFFNSVFAAATLAFSGFFGAWVIRIIEQSRERACLIGELEQSREEVARLSAERGALAERERMSREIHDTLAQGFTSVLMLVQAVQSELDRDAPLARRHLDLMESTARQNLAEARALVAGGAPADLDGGSLPDAVRRLAARHEPPASLAVSGGAREVPAPVEVVALRTCQEALSNARKHAGPGAPVAISLAYGEAALTVSVRDEGRGFDLAAPRTGYGLAGLRARAAEVGGAAGVRSAPGEGTAVTVQLPIPTRPLRSIP